MRVSVLVPVRVTAGVGDALGAGVLDAAEALTLFVLAAEELGDGAPVAEIGLGVMVGGPLGEGLSDPVFDSDPLEDSGEDGLEVVLAEIGLLLEEALFEALPVLDFAALAEVLASELGTWLEETGVEIKLVGLELASTVPDGVVDAL